MNPEPGSPPPLPTTPPTTPPPPPIPPPALDERQKKVIIGEIVVVIALGVLPHVVGVLYGWFRPPTTPAARTSIFFVHTALRNLQIIVPLLWIMYRSGRGWAYFGFKRFKLHIDLPLAVLVAITIGLAHWAMQWVVYAMSQVVPMDLNLLASLGRDDTALRSMHEPISGGLAWTAFVLYQMTNGFGEEMVLRGYLINRIREVSGSALVSVFVVAALAASYHIYQGGYAATVIFGGQLVLGWAYLKVPRTAAFAIGHGLFDIWVYVNWAIRIAPLG